MGTAEATDRLLRQTTLNLKVISWRLFLHGASREQPDGHMIEVRCHLEQPLLAGRIMVGTLSENLDSLVISIGIHSAQKYFEVASQKVDKERGGMAPLQFSDFLG